MPIIRREKKCPKPVIHKTKFHSTSKVNNIGSEALIWGCGRDLKVDKCFVSKLWSFWLFLAWNYSVSIFDCDSYVQGLT